MKIYPLSIFYSDLDFRKWLESNHDKSDGLRLVFYKKHTGKCSFSYKEALDVALCFGWIDSTVKRIDDEKHSQIFTPRKNIQNWSEVNKQKVLKLIEDKKMTIHGLNKIDEYLQDGKLSWQKRDLKKSPVLVPEIPEYLTKELQKSKKALYNFDKLSPSNKKILIKYITSAKREETQINRTHKTIASLLKNEKPGIL